MTDIISERPPQYVPVQKDKPNAPYEVHVTFWYQSVPSDVMQLHKKLKKPIHIQLDYNTKKEAMRVANYFSPIADVSVEDWKHRPPDDIPTIFCNY